jgi:hypothetical protein
MGFFRFRRSIQIAPGIRWNIGKKSTSFTFGPRGFKLTAGTRGVRTTVGLPGTGISYTHVNASGAKHKRLALTASSPELHSTVTSSGALRSTEPVNFSAYTPVSEARTPLRLASPRRLISATVLAVSAFGLAFFDESLIAGTVMLSLIAFGVGLTGGGWGTRTLIAIVGTGLLVAPGANFSTNRAEEHRQREEAARKAHIQALQQETLARQSRQAVEDFPKNARGMLNEIIALESDVKARRSEKASMELNKLDAALAPLLRSSISQTPDILVMKHRVDRQRAALAAQRNTNQRTR